MELLRSELHTSLPTAIAGRYLKKLSAEFWQTSGLLQDYMNFLLCEIDPLFSQKRLAAEIVSLQKETNETSTLVLRPSSRWKGFRAGQYINTEIEIEGARYRRNYSLSCSPKSYKETGLISITVKRVIEGKVSRYVNQNLNIGNVIHISQAMGEFTLPDPAMQSTSKKPVFIAGGSGITPIKSMIDQMAQAVNSNTCAQDPITLIHYAKNSSDIIFKAHFEQLSEQHSWFKYVSYYSDQKGNISAKNLQGDCPDLEQRDIYLCGPEGFMAAVLKIASSISVPEHQIHKESFGGGTTLVSKSKPGAPGKINFAYADRQVKSDGKHSLLELAELAGLKPKYGCRTGICHECKCQRPEGALTNRLTGQTIADDQRSVQACIAVPAGDITIKEW